MKNADMPAMPLTNSNGAPVHHSSVGMDNDGVMFGLTKREMMATSIISGCLAGGHFVGRDVELIPSLAVILTDKLLAELEKTGGKQQWNTKSMSSKF